MPLIIKQILSDLRGVYSLLEPQLNVILSNGVDSISNFSLPPTVSGIATYSQTECQLELQRVQNSSDEESVLIICYLLNEIIMAINGMSSYKD